MLLLFGLHMHGSFPMPELCLTCRHLDTLMEILAIVQAVMIGAQSALFWWKKKDKRSYELVRSWCHHSGPCLCLCHRARYSDVHHSWLSLSTIQEIIVLLANTSWSSWRTAFQCNLVQCKPYQSLICIWKGMGEAGARVKSAYPQIYAYLQSRM